MTTPLTLTAKTKAVTLTIVVEARKGQVVGVVNGFIGTLENVNGREAIHFDAKAIKALTGQKVERGAYLAVDRALSAAERAAALAAAPQATTDQRHEAACFAQAAATGQDVLLSRETCWSNGYTIESFRFATPAGAVHRASNNCY